MRHGLGAAFFALALFSVPSRSLAMTYPELSIAPVSLAPPLDPRAVAPEWQRAAVAPLDWEVQRGRTLTEATFARIMLDKEYVYLRFDVTQHEPVAQSQHTNDVGLGTDDEVWVDVWPNGVGGYQYQFVSTPNGTHYESSTENTTYAPRWVSLGATRADGYTVTMKIPLAVMRGAQQSRLWKIQFVRFIRSTGEQVVWSFDRAQTTPDDLARAGSLRVTQPLEARSSRPAPRLATYVLVSGASSRAGGSTSRLGADISIPLADTSSFFATFHPDYSNVELDQQTISPTSFQRSYAEVRPFFTQGANNFNNQYCNFCNGLAPLYTPAIPTPRAGYAIEGKQGPFGYTAFDSISVQRSDQASAVTYTSSDTRWNASLQRVAVDAPSLKDDEIVASGFYNDLKHVVVYANYGEDSGTNVTHGNRAQYYDSGATWTSQTFSIWGGLHKLGSDFNPVDAFVTRTGVAGWGLFANKIWTFSNDSPLGAVALGGALLRNHGEQTGLNQSSNKLDLDILTRKTFDFNFTTGSSYLLLQNGVFSPISQNGVTVTYHSGSQTNNPISFDAHGPSSTPTILGYNTGRYGDGRLDTWIRSSTIRLGRRGTVSLDLDDTSQWLLAGGHNIQWFERLGYTDQIDSDSSFSIGIRNVVGDPPVPNGGGNCEGRCANISVAYYKRLTHVEFYFAYGDPNALSTLPQLLFKAIFYAGAQKGS